MGWIGKELGKGALRGAVQHAVAVYLLPLGAPVVTVAIGYSSDLPWFWIWLGALAAFAFVSTGLLQFSLWADRRRVESKLYLAFPGIVPIQNEGYALGVHLHNMAARLVDVELSEIRSQINHRIPIKKGIPMTQLTLQPNLYGWFYDNPILFDIPSPGSVEGILEAELKYGPKGTVPKYMLSVKKQFVARFDDDGKLLGQVLWTDIVAA